MTRDVIEVFTNKSAEFMLEHGGSASWVIGMSSASSLKFCVCCRNDEPPRDDDAGERGEMRNEAFLVGKVSGITFVEEQNGRNRYLLQFSEYAYVSVEGFRSGTTRNPVTYSDVADCRSRGLDINALEFKPMPPVTKPYVRAEREPTEIAVRPSRKGLSIAEAKEGLSIYFDVPIEAIQITISG